jgi:hypothetical protein
MDKSSSKRENIKQKQEQGLKLAQKIYENTQPEKFAREQRYEIFINKMMQLYKFEKNRARRSRKILGRMASAPMMTDEPVKQILYEYGRISQHGIQGDELYHSMDLLTKTVLGRGMSDPRSFTDYTIHELDTSQRMYKVAEDIKYTLSDEQYISAHHLAALSRTLGQLSYKNTEIIPKWFEKINHMVEEKFDESNTVRDPDTQKIFDTAIYGSYLGQKPRHYIYQGHEFNEEYQTHLKTLLEFKDRRARQNLEASQDVDVQELEKSIA